MNKERITKSVNYVCWNLHHVAQYVSAKSQSSHGAIDRTFLIGVTKAVLGAVLKIRERGYLDGKSRFISQALLREAVSTLATNPVSVVTTPCFSAPSDAEVRQKMEKLVVLSSRVLVAASQTPVAVLSVQNSNIRSSLSFLPFR